MRSDKAFKQALKAYLHVIRNQEKGIRENQDIEHLHKYRVATRRTRTLLLNSKEIFPKNTRLKFKREFDRIGNITGPSRDLSLYIAALDEYKTGFHEKRQSDINSYIEYLVKRQEKEHNRIIKLLDSKRYKKVIQAWKKYITRPGAKNTRLKYASLPIAEIAPSLIWQTCEKALNKCEKLDDNTSEHKIHQLRKMYKNLRYLVEIFRSEDKKTADTLLSNFKNLQDIFGDYQDTQVQILYLDNYIKQISKKDSNKTALESMSMLKRKIEQRKMICRKNISSICTDFCAGDDSLLYRNLIK